jgi:hypothetical protein
VISIDRTGPRVTSGTSIRFLSTLSEQWLGEFQAFDGAFAVRNGVSFYACHFDEDRHSVEFYTDYDDMSLEEVRLLASIALTVGYEDGLRLIYPDPAIVIVPHRIELHTPEGMEEAWQLALGYLKQPGRRGLADPPLPWPKNKSDNGTRFDSELQARIFGAIDLTNHVLMRGLATWVKSGMLWMHRAFAEEANYPLFISLEASFSCVRKVLRNQGNPDPSALDAGEFIHEAFGEEPSGYKYFEEFYEDRIRAMHPDNRFGTFVYAPLGRDDFYWLFRGLREVWRLLIMGEAIAPPLLHPCTS